MRTATLTSLTALAASCLLVGCAPAGKVAAYDIPRMNDVVVDGKADDWSADGQGAGGFRVELLAPIDGAPKPSEDFDARVRLGWDDRGLLLMATVEDDRPIEHEVETLLWQHDAIEVFLAPRQGAPDICQWVIAPGVAPDQPKLRWHLHDHRKDKHLKELPGKIDAARTRTANGYILEALFPWSALAIEPEVGREVAFQVDMIDADLAERSQPYVATWFPAVGTFMDSKRAQTLRLADAPSAPAIARASGDYDLDHLRSRITVFAAAGKSATVSDGQTVLARASFTPKDRLVAATLLFPLPDPGKPFGPLTVAIDGRDVATVTMPDFAAARDLAFDRAGMSFRPAAFSRPEFPVVDFDQPLKIEGLFGPYTLSTAFYDANYNEVTSAAEPGRYGAIVTIRRADGHTSKRFFTLFALTEKVPLYKRRGSTPIEVLGELGIDPVVARQQTEAIAGHLMAIVRDADFSQDAAITLAGLFETAPGTPAVQRTGPARRDEWWWHGLKKKTGDTEPLRYHVRVPEGADKDKVTLRPAILFLHGSGGREVNFETIARIGPAPMLAKQTELPFILISPQCPEGEAWSVPKLNDLIDEVFAKYPIDPGRFYLTGYSMGGMGTWDLALEMPERFAAVVPICGRGDPRDVARLKDTPVWVFHGGRDPSVPVHRSIAMVDAVREIGGRVEFTVYPEVGHNSWTRTYANEDLYKWLLQQRLGRPTQPRAIEPRQRWPACRRAPTPGRIGGNAGRHASSAGQVSQKGRRRSSAENHPGNPGAKEFQ